MIIRMFQVLRDGNLTIRLLLVTHTDFDGVETIVTGGNAYSEQVNHRKDTLYLLETTAKPTGGRGTEPKLGQYFVLRREHVANVNWKVVFHDIIWELFFFDLSCCV